MKFIRGFLIFSALLAIGTYFGSVLLSLRVDEVELAAHDPSPRQAHLSRDDSVEAPNSTAWEIEFPQHALADEMVIHFTSREDYLDYLKALRDAGLAPLDQIDELLAVRIGRDAMVGATPGLYGGEGRFSYRVEQPLPPVEIAPELIAQLRAFGAPADAIIGGQIDGDGAGVLVGILDSGISDHSQFDEIDLVNLDLTGGGVGGPGAAHGTAVASIIAGSEGIAPAAELFVIRVLDEQGAGSSFDVAQGIVLAADEGVQVLNMSLGVYQDTQLLREAVLYAESKGVIMVAAAGNDAYTQMPYPAAYPQVLSVTAVDSRGRQALFPNQSELIDFAAPGVGVLTAKEDEGTMLFSGTSAAAPFVTGTVAAMLSAQPSRSAAQVVDLIKRHLDDAGSAGVDAVYGGGIVNWDRLRERDTAGILDVAIADIYLQPDARPGTTMPVELIVQNRGTNWVTTATLTVQVGEDEPVDFTIGTLGPGQTTTRKVYTPVPALNSDEVLDIAAQILTETPTDDVRLENNIKAVFFKPIQ